MLGGRRLRPAAVLQLQLQLLIPGRATSCRFGDRADARLLLGHLISVREKRRGAERPYLPSFQMSVASFQSFPTFSQITTYLPLSSCGDEPFVLSVKVPISRAADGPNDFTSRVLTFGSLTCSAMLFHMASIAALPFTMGDPGG